MCPPHISRHITIQQKLNLLLHVNYIIYVQIIFCNVSKYNLNCMDNLNESPMGNNISVPVSPPISLPVNIPVFFMGFGVIILNTLFVNIVWIHALLILWGFYMDIYIGLSIIGLSLSTLFLHIKPQYNYDNYLLKISSLWSDYVVIFDNHESPSINNDMSRGTNIMGLPGGKMYCVHPHGVFNTQPITTITSRHFNNTVILGSSVALYYPVMRIICAIRGSIDEIKKNNFTKYWNNNRDVLIYPGGLKEMIYCEPHSENIMVYMRHTGFIRLAIQNGASIVPCFCFGENDAYTNILDFINIHFNKIHNRIILPPISYSKSILQGKRIKYALVIGDRIQMVKKESPTPEEITQITNQYCTTLQNLFDKYKDKYNYGDRKLCIIR